MNRRDRRAADSQVRRRIGRKRNVAAEAICVIRGHVLEDVWVMRPALVGAGIVIPKVHYDRNCKRCGSLDSVWADIDGATSPQPTAMSLRTWLEVNGASAPAPDGEIRYPAVDELGALMRKAAGT